MSKRLIFLGTTFFLLYTVLWVVVLFKVHLDLQKALMPKQLQTYIVQSVLTGNTRVENKTIAAKLDLQRKIIKPSSPQKVAEISRVVKEQGGDVIQTKSGIMVVHIPKDREEAVKQELIRGGNTKSVEVDYPAFVTADSPDWGVTRIQAPEVWGKTTASGVKIAVIDTGIDYNHKDLQGRYAGGYDTVNEDSDPFDGNGHGTHVSGIIASSLNGDGTAGVAPGGQILAIKALADDGSGYVSDVIEGVDYAIKNGAQVINFSLGSTANVKALEDKLNEAAAKGIILVAAAGNTNGGGLLYPAAYGSVISVAATDANDNFASFSSIGAEIAAPGVAITSTAPGNNYAAWSGTSMAAPHVAATAALMLANGQTNIREALHNTAIDLGPPGKDGYFGYGLVHAEPAALGEDNLSPIVTFLSPDNGSTVYGPVHIKLNVQDESQLSSITLFANGQKLQEWTDSPSDFIWDTTGKDGVYELLLQARDVYHNLGEAKIQVMVSKEPIPPTPTEMPLNTEIPGITLTPNSTMPTQMVIPTRTKTPIRITPTRTITPIHTVPPTPTQINYPGNSDDNRQNINKEEPIEKKIENFFFPNNPQDEVIKNEEQKDEEKKNEEKKQEKSSQPNLQSVLDSALQTVLQPVLQPVQQVPNVSNINERNQKPVPTLTPTPTKKISPGQAKKAVKGASTMSLGAIIKAYIAEFFGIR